MGCTHNASRQHIYCVFAYAPDTAGMTLHHIMTARNAFRNVFRTVLRYAAVGIANGGTNDDLSAAIQACDASRGAPAQRG